MFCFYLNQSHMLSVSLSYRVSFTKVKPTTTCYDKRELMAIEIRISPGIRIQLYEDELHEVSSTQLAIIL